MSPILGIWASQNYSRYSITGSYESIATTTVGAGGSTSITFSSIPSTYTHLQLRVLTQVSTTARFGISFNSDTTLANYRTHYLYGDGTSAGAGTGASSWGIGAATSTSSNYGATVADILDYGNTNKYKTIRSLSGYDNNGSGLMVLYSGLWMSTSAVSSMTIYPAENSTSGGTFSQYSSFALYGIRGN
jgi:hypothetical protein